MPVLTEPVALEEPVTPATRRARVALLGFGQVGAAVAARAAAPPVNTRLQIAGALVRDPARRSPPGVPLVTDVSALWDPAPDAVIEVLGGLEPARTCVLGALERGIPVVTANKSLIAHHGDELLAASRRNGVALRYEASVVAGVPFLGTLARRPLARDVSQVTGILNGTSNFVLTRVSRNHEDIPTALDEARRLGFAEADATKDLDGTDAAEKLSVLIRLLGHRFVHPSVIARTGIGCLQPADLQQASEFGGVIKPVATADWSAGPVTSFVGPAFLPLTHPLASLEGVTNAVCLSRPGHAHVVFSGPGAGPHVTAATVLDDVLELLGEDGGRTGWSGLAPRASIGAPSESAWFVRLDLGAGAPDQRDVADLLGSFGVWIARTASPGGIHHPLTRWILTHPVAPARLSAALEALALSCGCRACSLPILEDSNA
jgi:homoserine dehydrogenase